MANVFIDILAEFTGKKAFKQAETSTDKLTRNVKNLGKTFGLTFGTAAVLSYGKAAVKAAAEDEAAQASLAQTLKNLGFQSVGTANALNDYISTLERTTGKLDDELRPAMDRLLRATGSVTKSQELMNLALDIAAGTGKDLGQVTQSLQKAYLGQTQALGRLGVGLSKAELSSSSFEQIQARLTDLFAGQGKRAAESYEGSMNKLAVATNNVKENIGIGIIDALTALSNDNTIESLTTDMENLSIYVADVVRGIGNVASGLKDIPGFNIPLENLIQAIPILGSYISLLAQSGAATRDINMAAQKFGGIYATKYQQQANAAAEKLALEYAKKQALLAKQKADQEKKALAAKKLSAAIDKANLALNKSQDVFDLDKIQVAAALTNQAEQLGKATSASQALQIANDTARLNVKRSILELEDAIASKDEASIIAATNKLNADLKVLGALTGQSVKLSDIKGILESLKPADLINLSNLDAAIAKMLELIRLQGVKPPTTGTTGAPVVGGGAGVLGGAGATTAEDLHLSKLASQAVSNMLKPTLTNTPFGEGGLFNLEDVARSSLIAGLAGGAGVSGAVSGSRYAAQAANQYNITVQAGIGDPNAIAEAIDNVLREARDRGTLTIA
jgi:hypothetical protein